MLRHRMLHEHDIFELCYVNNRWYTRTDRVMVLFSRLTLKFSVCAIFFLWSRNFGTFQDLYGQGTGNLDVGGKTVAIACSFTANKVLGTLFKGFFVFLAGRRRRQLYDHLLQVAQGAKSIKVKNEMHSHVVHDIRRLEAEAMMARHRGQYDAGHFWEPLLRCMCRICTSSKSRLSILSVVIWTLSLGIDGFLLVFLVGYGFALQEDRVHAWIQSAIISCIIWLCFTTPLKILLKTTFQLFCPKTYCAKVCCCSSHSHGGNHGGKEVAEDTNGLRETKTMRFSKFEAELVRMKKDIKDVHDEILTDRQNIKSNIWAEERRRFKDRGRDVTAQKRTRPSSVDKQVENIFMATHTTAFSPVANRGTANKRWSLYEATEGTESVF